MKFKEVFFFIKPLKFAKFQAAIRNESKLEKSLAFILK